jgi:flagellar hook protein FlgE
MLQAMFNGISGLRAHKTMLDVIGNNIANINTTGYKSSRTTFKDMLSQTISGAANGINPAQVGMGTSVASIDINNTGGALQQTGRNMDVAIQGNGYLMLSDGTSKYYTRDGALDTDAQGNLVSSSSGLNVLGWMADPVTGLINSTTQITSASSIKLPIGQMSLTKQTSSASYAGNLNADSATGATAASEFQIYDSLGVDHPLNITFTKTANPGEWSWSATSADATGSVGSGLVTFDSSGNCTTPLVRQYFRWLFQMDQQIQLI